MSEVETPVTEEELDRESQDAYDPNDDPLPCRYNRHSYELIQACRLCGEASLVNPHDGPPLED